MKPIANKHVIAHCPRYANARADFNGKTGLTLYDATYTSVMALDHKKLQVEAATLAKHMGHMDIDSAYMVSLRVRVAVPTGT